MNKLAPAIALTLAALALTGCSLDVKQPSPVETRTVTPSPVEEAPTPTPDVAELDAAAADYGFLTTVHDASPITASIDDATVIAAGHGACTFLDTGLTPLEVLDVMAGQGIDQTTALAVTGAAIGVYCPEYASLLG